MAIYKANRLPVTRLRVARRSRLQSDWHGTMAGVVVVIAVAVFLLAGC